jgi:hypothetical protein
MSSTRSTDKDIEFDLVIDNEGHVSTEHFREDEEQVRALFARLEGAPVPGDPRALADAVAERVAEFLGREQQLAPILVDVAGAARLLGITGHAFRSRLQRGQIPRAAVVRTGRRLQFRPDKLVRER